jgi:hypothetical protein
MNYLEDISVLQEVCLALHNLGEGSLGAWGFVFLEDQAKAAPSAGAPGVHCSGSWLPMRLAGRKKRGQERRSQQPFPSLTELDPEISGCHC